MDKQLGEQGMLKQKALLPFMERVMRVGKIQGLLVGVIISSMLMGGCGKANTGKWKSDLSKPGTYSVLKEDRLGVKIVVSILVRKDIPELEIIETLKWAYSFYKASNSDVVVRMFVSKEQYISDRELWLAKAGPGSSDVACEIEIDRDQLQYLQVKPEEKFGLSEEKRKEMRWQFCVNDDQSEIDAIKAYPDLDEKLPGWSLERAQRRLEARARHKEMLAKKWRDEAPQKYGLTIEQLKEVGAEGIKMKWPLPPAPDLKKLSDSMKTSHRAMNGEWTKLRGGYFMTTSKEDYDQAYGLYRSKDEAAVKKMFMSGLLQATIEGADVFVEDYHVFSNEYEIRLKGDTRIYWVDEDGVYFVGPPSTDASSELIPVVQNNADICKIDGISVDRQGAAVFVSHGKGFDPVEVGGHVCGVEVIKIYAPRELDGITPTNIMEFSEYRVRIKFPDGERILKNGDYISGSPESVVQEPVQPPVSASATETGALAMPLQVSSNVGRDTYRKLCDDAASEFNQAEAFDKAFQNEEALEKYTDVLPKAKEAYSTINIDDKGRMQKIITQSERRERELSKYLELVRGMRNEVTSPESLEKWLRKNVQYKYERYSDDYWQGPDETLAKKDGDCEDYAFLVQALLNEIGIKSKVVAVTYTEGARRSGHAICVFQYGVGYTYFSCGVLKELSSFSMEQLVKQAYPGWIKIDELDFRTKSRIEIAKK